MVSLDKNFSNIFLYLQTEDDLTSDFLSLYTKFFGLLQFALFSQYIPKIATSWNPK